MNFIKDLGLILLVTMLLGQLFIKIKLPAVIGELLAGVVLGPAILNWVQPTSTLSIFSELGVIILMFIAGLSSDLESLKKYFKLSFTIAASGILLPVLLMGLASYLFGMNLIPAIFCGIIFSATSVSISLVVLQEKKQLNSPSGNAILGAAVIDDVLAVLLLSIFNIFSHTETNGNSRNNFFLNLLVDLLFFIGLWLVYRYLAPFLMNWASNNGLNEIIVALILMLALSWLADHIGLSSVVGSFFAGLAIGQTKNNQVKLSTFNQIGNSSFIPIFFVNIGLSVTFTSFKKDFWFILVMTILAIFSKFWAGKYSSRLFKMTKKESNIVGAGMISRGEVALIVAQMGIKAHLIAPDIYSSVILVIIITTILSPFILNYFLTKKEKI